MMRGRVPYRLVMVNDASAQPLGHECPWTRSPHAARERSQTPSTLMSMSGRIRGDMAGPRTSPCRADAGEPGRGVGERDSDHAARVGGHGERLDRLAWVEPVAP